MHEGTGSTDVVLRCDGGDGSAGGASFLIPGEAADGLKAGHVYRVDFIDLGRQLAPAPQLQDAGTGSAAAGADTPHHPQQRPDADGGSHPGRGLKEIPRS